MNKINTKRLVKRGLVPNMVKSMTNQELSGLLTYLKLPLNSGLQEFSKKCVKNSMDSIVRFAPLGHNGDYFNWGYMKGLLKAHELYRDLKKMLEIEKSNRENKDI